MQIDNTPVASPHSWMTLNKSINDNNNDLSIAQDNHKPIEKSKRKQVKNACVNCQKACKKCDDGRPCKRCVKLGLTATCRDSDRKERKKGVKRGPYKKRQAYIKDKPVYPKLTEEHWNTPIYEIVPQVLSHSNDQSIYNDFYDDNSYCVPSQSSSLSPASSSSFVDESDETLHYAYGYRYTTNNNTTTMTSSPSASSMLDNPTISGNVTPILDTTFSWDDSYSSASPIGCNPIMNFATTTSFPIYQQQVQQQKAFTFEQPIMTNNDLLVDTNNYWCNNNNNTNDVSLLYQPYPIQPTDQLNYFEYSIPPQYNNDNTAWAFAN